MTDHHNLISNKIIGNPISSGICLPSYSDRLFLFSFDWCPFSCLQHYCYWVVFSWALVLTSWHAVSSVYITGTYFNNWADLCEKWKRKTVKEVSWKSFMLARRMWIKMESQYHHCRLAKHLMMVIMMLSAYSYFLSSGNKQKSMWKWLSVGSKHKEHLALKFRMFLGIQLIMITMKCFADMRERACFCTFCELLHSLSIDKILV